MKLHIGFVSILFLVFLGSFTGCNKQAGLAENDLQFSEFKLDTVCHLFNDTARPACNFKLDMKYPSASNDAKLLDSVQKIFIESYLGAQYASESPAIAAQNYMKSYVNDYLELEKDSIMFNRAVKEGWGLASFNYEEISSSEIKFNRGGFFSYAVSIYSFTGGAHGMNGTNNHVINLETKSLMTLNDLFPETSLQDVGSLIIGQIAKDRNFTNPAQLNEDGFFSIEDVVPTDNFYINEEGIGWVYNPYEIAVYATGQIHVFLDWSTVKPYLQEETPVMKLVEESEK
ncbi:MAG: DUF3298 and DUF4163 domain-containing protein [Bacteroidales bacterium]